MHDGRFWMCDWMAGEVLVFGADGDRDVVARVEGLPFSIDWLPDGRLVATTPGRVGGRAGPGAVRRDRAALQRDRGGCRGSGVGGHAGLDAVGAPKPGIVSVVLPDGSSRQVADDVWFPNGMIVLGDDTLVVAESHADRLTAWTITDAGDLVDRQCAGRPRPGFGSGRHLRGRRRGHLVRQRCRTALHPSAEGGEVLDTVTADRGCFACMLGGDDGRTLYIVANHWSDGGASDGVVLVHPVAVPHAGSTLRRPASGDGPLI